MKQSKKRIAFLLCITLLFSIVVSPNHAEAKAAELANTNLTMTEGKSKQLNLKNNKKNVIWSVASGKKYVQLKKKSKTGVLVVGKKPGEALIQAKIEKKTYSCKVTVKKQTKAAKNKILVAYFSMADKMPKDVDAVTYATPTIGNTQTAALEIQKQTGGDLFAIQTEKSYPIRHEKCSSVASKELEADARPKLASHVKNMADYGTVYIEFPIWVYREPMAVRTFLEEYDFSGKTIIPFCTSMAVGIQTSIQDIKELCPNATVLDGLRLETEEEDFSKMVSRWLKKRKQIS